MPVTQWIPWIHLDDIAGIYAWAVHTDTVSSPINAVVPHPVRSREFSATLEKAMRWPSWLPVPKIALQLIMGEVAPYMLFSQHASSRKIVYVGYMFKYLDLLPALQEVVERM